MAIRVREEPARYHRSSTPAISSSSTLPMPARFASRSACSSSRMRSNSTPSPSRRSPTASGRFTTVRYSWAGSTNGTTSSGRRPREKCYPCCRPFMQLKGWEVESVAPSSAVPPRPQCDRRTGLPVLVEHSEAPPGPPRRRRDANRRVRLRSPTLGCRRAPSVDAPT